jgi:hypothetical protein
MGAYLSEPNLNKESIDDTDGKISFGASSMQGWRLDQEVFLFILNHYFVKISYIEILK